jgi:hypothetical protein
MFYTEFGSSETHFFTDSHTIPAAKSRNSSPEIEARDLTMSGTPSSLPSTHVYMFQAKTKGKLCMWSYSRPLIQHQ